MFCATGAMSGFCSAAPRLRVISLFLDVRGLASMVKQGTLQRLRVFICFCPSLRQDLRGAWVQGLFMSFQCRVRRIRRALPVAVLGAALFAAASQAGSQYQTLYSFCSQSNCADRSEERRVGEEGRSRGAP